MRKLTRITALAAIAISALTGSAANYHGLKITLLDESTVFVKLSDDMKAIFTPSHLKITGTGQDVEVPREKLATFQFTEQSETDGVEETTVAADPFLQDGYMVFTGLKEGTGIKAYSPDGRLILSETASGDFSLDLKRLPKGSWIVTVNSISYKINVR